MNAILEKKGFICDMDGVIYHGSRILDGVKDFVNQMIESGKKTVKILSGKMANLTVKSVYDVR